MRSTLVTLGLFIGLALLAPSPARAQTGGVQGKVIDEESKPVAGAGVIVENERVSRKTELKTNKRGEYRMIGLPPGPYRVTATKDGYQARYVEVNVHLGDPTDVTDIQIVSLEAIAKVTGPSESDLRNSFNHGVELIRAGQLDDAEAIFLDLVKLQPDVGEFHQDLGYIYAKRKDWARARESYSRALELKPGEPAIVVGLAGVYEDSGQPEKAQELLDRATAEDPANASFQFERGMLLLKAQKVPEATEAFEKALAADASMTEVHYYLGTLLVNQGKVPEAVEHFEAYLASEPKNAQYAETARKLLAALKK